eukprot:TRINITY_DN12641_c0_g1_i5.p1 TRINITY_DN12641_c0_g1~~TRINITY_DN12641_c0_g1_i5.p1  ORF type:complete len:559 (+),score=132.91 TRINITY_DN12641_c0_g1_i5:89-1765(+)
MDPYKVLGIPQHKIKAPSDLNIARERAKKLYKRYAGEKRKFDAKKVLEAFDMVKRNMKKIGEGEHKLIGRSRKERELDRHFNHQTKEIKKSRTVKKELRNARYGERRMHLPGDKERIPRYHRSRKRRRAQKEKEMRRAKYANVDILQGLNRLAAVLPQKSKFPKVIKLLHRWLKEYMNIDNREYVFVVLNNITRLEHLAQDRESRHDVLVTFEYVLTYFQEWFEMNESNQMLREAWRTATILTCGCYTDDAFTLNGIMRQLGEAFSLIEKHQATIESHLEDKAKREAKLEFKAEVAKLEEKGIKVESKFGEVKVEGNESGKPAASAASPMSNDASPTASPDGNAPVKEEGDEEDFFGGGCDDSDDDDDDEDDESEDKESDEEAEAAKTEAVKKEPKDNCVILDSDEDGEVKEEILSSGESDQEGEALGESIFPIPASGESLAFMRETFVTKCLQALFINRGPLWARTKIDNFFQDVFYRKACLDEKQQMQVSAWQARIKVLQKEGEHKIGEVNNISESKRPVVDSREDRTVFDADSNAWSGKQTFDAREVAGGRNVIR